MHRCQRRQFLNQPIAPRNGLPALHRLAVTIDRSRRQIAFAIGKRFVKLGREAVRQIIQHIFARRDVDLDIAPFLGRDFGKAALHQRLAGRNDLDHRGMAVPEIALDGCDQRRRLHRRDEMVEETLFCRFERGPGRGFCLRVERACCDCDVCRLHGCFEIVMDDREAPRIGIVDADLFVGQTVFDQFVRDALIGKRAGRIEAKRFHIAGEYFHRRDTAGLDRFDELAARHKRKVLAAPEPETLGVGEVMNCGGSGRRDIDDARVRQGMLKAKPGAALLRRGLVAAVALAACGILHRVALIENDDTIKIGAQPFDDLFDPRNLLVARVGAQRGVGGEKDALLQPDRRPLPEPRERRHQKPFDAERRPVALGVLDQLVGLADPHRAAAALQPIVKQDAGDLTALARAGAISQKPAAPELYGIVSIVARRADEIKSLVNSP